MEKMDLLPAIPLSRFSASDGSGGLAVNVHGNLFASVNRNHHCVYIYNAVDRIADAVVVGTAGTCGSAHGLLNYPAMACFVHRNGVDTLLISDWANDRIVEVTARGDFRRAIKLKKGCMPFGVAYCGTGDVIAVSLNDAHAVVLLEYESGAVKPEVTIGSGARRIGDGQLYHPRGVTFMADGRYVLVADWGNDRVSKFSAASGAFIAHVATITANGISCPSDVLQYADGSIVVSQGYGSADRSVVCVGEDGVTVGNIIIRIPSGAASKVSSIFTPRLDACIPNSLSYSAMLNGVVVKTFSGDVFLLRSAWMSSSRCAWLAAFCVR
jgi:hypothetical protein